MDVAAGSSAFIMLSTQSSWVIALTDHAFPMHQTMIIAKVAPRKSLNGISYMGVSH